METLDILAKIGSISIIMVVLGYVILRISENEKLMSFGFLMLYFGALVCALDILMIFMYLIWK